MIWPAPLAAAGGKRSALVSPMPNETQSILCDQSRAQNDKPSAQDMRDVQPDERAHRRPYQLAGGQHDALSWGTFRASQPLPCANRSSRWCARSEPDQPAHVWSGEGEVGSRRRSARGRAERPVAMCVLCFFLSPQHVILCSPPKVYRQTAHANLTMLLYAQTSPISLAVHLRLSALSQRGPARAERRRR
jgi:hypothetical protein